MFHYVDPRLQFIQSVRRIIGTSALATTGPASTSGTTQDPHHHAGVVDLAPLKRLVRTWMAWVPANWPGKAGCKLSTFIGKRSRNVELSTCIQPASTIRSGL